MTIASTFGEPLRVAWLGQVPYGIAHAIQRLLWADNGHNYLLLLEHPPVYTLGVFAKPEHVLRVPADVGADLVRTNRGGDVTYHGPGQLVGYPIVSVPRGRRSIPNYVHGIEQLVIDALAVLGLPGATRKDRYPGVWVCDEKICAVGVRVSRERSMHGFALNIDPDMAMFEHIVPCGISEFGVTSLALQGISVTTDAVVEIVSALAARLWGPDLERFDVLDSGAQLSGSGSIL